MTEFKWIFILFINFLIIELANTNSLLTSEDTQRAIFRALKTSECKLDCSTQKRRPVCGTDGKTYESRCLVKRAKRCEGRNVDIARRGHCTGSSSHSRSWSKCFEERNRARAAARNQAVGVFIPDCNSDGSFAKVQCHRATGYCWCALKDGRHISGSSVTGERPKCRGKSGRRKKRKKGKKRGCNPHDRTIFNKNINKVFAEEYARVKDSLGDNQGLNDPVMNTPEKRVVEWKFSELDKDKDDFLRFKEVRNFRRMVKKSIKPKSCAKTFINHCDGDQNNKIARSEWSLCLGVDIDISFQLFMILNSEEKTTPSGASQDGDKLLGIPPFIFNRPRLTPSKKKNRKQGPPPLGRHIKDETTPKPDDDSDGQNLRIRNCTEERKNEIKRHGEYPNGGIFIPTCTADGKWARAQCHKSTQVCWCADPDTGKPMLRTATLKVQPNCENVKPERPMKGCPHDKKRQFLMDLMKQLEQEMKANNSIISLDKNTRVTKQEKIARWKYNALDKNRNGILERKELKHMKKQIKSNSSTRKCRRRFVRYCDDNGDKKVIMEEWIDCMGINHNYYHQLPVNPKRQGRNPFIDQLT